MLYTGSSEIEERVVELLIEGRMTVKSLFATIGKDEKVSLRGIYKAVEKLTADGVALKVGKRVMLNHEWADKVAQKLATPTVPLINPGERAVYSYASLEHLDAFWKSTVLPLERVIAAKEVFIYNPHSFWALLPERKASEEAFFTHFGPAQQGFLTIGGDSSADLALKRQYQTEYLQINLQNIPSIRRTDHIILIGPYIILTRLSKTVSDRMDALYDSGRAVEEFLPELLKICTKPGKVRFVLENNPKKAEKLRKTLAKEFYFRKPE